MGLLPKIGDLKLTLLYCWILVLCAVMASPPLSLSVCLPSSQCCPLITWPQSCSGHGLPAIVSFARPAGNPNGSLCGIYYGFGGRQLGGDSVREKVALKRAAQPWADDVNRTVNDYSCKTHDEISREQS